MLVRSLYLVNIAFICGFALGAAAWEGSWAAWFAATVAVAYCILHLFRKRRW